MHFIEATSRGVETNLPQAAWIWVVTMISLDLGGWVPVVSWKEQQSARIHPYRFGTTVCSSRKPIFWGLRSTTSWNEISWHQKQKESNSWLVTLQGLRTSASLIGSWGCHKDTCLDTNSMLSRPMWFLYGFIWFYECLWWKMSSFYLPDISHLTLCSDGAVLRSTSKQIKGWQLNIPICMTYLHLQYTICIYISVWYCSILQNSESFLTPQIFPKSLAMENLPAICEEPGHLRRGDLGGDLCAGAQPAHCHLGALAEGGPLGGGCGWGVGAGDDDEKESQPGNHVFFFPMLMVYCNLASHCLHIITQCKC